MAYKLEHVTSDHVGVLVGTMQKWANSQPDLYIISEEGHKIYTQKLLIGFYSITLSSIFRTFNDSSDIPGISVPASSSSIVNLLKVLATGIVITKVKGDLHGINQTAEAMGITMDNCQIGVKNSTAKVSQMTSKPTKSNTGKNSKDNETANASMKLEPVVENEHLSDETGKKHFCEDCGKGFGRKAHLNRHVLIHSGIVYECEICNSKYKRKEGLDKHKSEAHGIYPVEEDLTKLKVEPNFNMDDSVSEGPVGNEEIEKDEDDSKYACQQCQKTFKNRTHLLRHETSHSGVKLSCDECPSTFSRKDKLNAHVRKKHVLSTDVENIDETEEKSDKNPKFECPYCEELVEDLAVHCLEFHGAGDAATEEETLKQQTEDE